ncbi:MAG TPA: SMI1/KNR4 family protein [Candidatus Eisenbacteria bacterium]|nr:SMI1/KNR4 family protein [Candidatus Eisenbacteria bacterium]
MVKERERRAKPVAAYARAARRIAQEVGSSPDDVFSPAEETDMESLTQLGMPDSVLGFYRDFAPIETIELRELRLWDVAHLLEENHHYSPGAEILELGYVVVAGNRAGDVYCLDLGEWGDEDPPPIVHLPHRVQIVSRDRAEVEKQTTPVADSFDEFLLLFASGEAASG